ncbi:MAG: phosphoribosylaminoimidazolesuccinocarboxamide synthase [Gemmatimonadales bacterium]|nr:MAG: phosphoribosylaminoimidazolesuccinocarboxamide synthase [Gemmatimonadales bacterium]
MTDTPLRTSDLPLPLLVRGKVREMYAVDSDHLLMTASDRVSAFDVVLDPPIPEKGRVLTAVTAIWLARLEKAQTSRKGPGGLRGLLHHGVSADPEVIAERVPALDTPELRPRWEGRSLLVRRTRPLPVECVVRGYLAGSAWREVRDHGTLAGEGKPPGLPDGFPEGIREADRLPDPIFSPATKAEAGDHDENISWDRVVEILGEERAREVRDRSLALYRWGASRAARAGLILADTKFEFGLDDEDRLVLIDEVMTPDSSRYWTARDWSPGSTPPSLDKQPVRDWLASVEGWDGTAPAPTLPHEVVESTTRRYLDLLQRLERV